MGFWIKKGQKCQLRIDERETEAVKIAVFNLAMDLENILGVSVKVSQDDKEKGIPKILIGTLGVSEVIKDLADVSEMYDETGRLQKGAYLHSICEYTLHLIIVGSDKQGTIYGIYDLCKMLGVFPCYFQKGVAIQIKQTFSLHEDYVKLYYPSIKYRGIFINDEKELEAWVQNYMGEVTSGAKTYEKIFELLLRLKGNYIWSSMNVNSFNISSENSALADRMGIVVEASQCNMLMNSNNHKWKSWIQKKGYTKAIYDYSIKGKNRSILKEYWKENVEQDRDVEVCYTLNIQEISDSEFETKNIEEKTKEEIRNDKITLLQKIITKQREILKHTLEKETKMTFNPYKEVLELYHNGQNISEYILCISVFYSTGTYKKDI